MLVFLCLQLLQICFEKKSIFHRFNIGFLQSQKIKKIEKKIQNIIYESKLTKGEIITEWI